MVPSINPTPDLPNNYAPDLPNEVLVKIFSYAVRNYYNYDSPSNAALVTNMSLVCRKWNECLQTDDKEIWGKPKMLIDEEVWAKIGITVEKLNLPFKKLCHYSKMPCPFNNKTIEDTHIFAVMPKGLTLNKIYELVKNEKFYIAPEILKQYGDVPVKDTYLVGMLKNVIPNSESKCWFEHLWLINNISEQTWVIRNENKYRLPKIIEGFTILSMAKIIEIYKERIDLNTNKRTKYLDSFIRCENLMKISGTNYSAIISQDSSKIILVKHYDFYKELDASACRNFSKAWKLKLEIVQTTEKTTD